MRKSICFKGISRVAFLSLMLLIMLTGCGDNYILRSVRDIGSAIVGSPPVQQEEPEVSEVYGTDIPETEDAVADYETGVQETDNGEIVETYIMEEEDAVLSEPEIPVGVSNEKYAYSTLSDEDKVIYDQIYDTIVSQKTDVAISTTDKDTLKRVYECVLADHGEIFWASGYVYHVYSVNDEIVNLTFSPNYLMDMDQRAQMQQRIDAVVADWLEGISYEASDYEKSRYIYQTLIKNVAYDANSTDNQNIISVFINQKTVCQGYANAVAYLAQKLGLQAAVVTGYANGELHAWNLIKLDGQYYYLDSTWGNSSYMDMTDSKQRFVNFAYLNITTEEISATHTAQVSFPLPECVSVEDNYYRHEGKWFDSPDYDAIGRIIGEAYAGGESTATVKLSGSDLYRAVHEYFIEDSHIAEYCPGITTVSYLQSEDMGVLTLLF
ncbi:MAG: hypothetical protein J6N76_03320 [Lachnospiraceae bacterium]|nr:hypothetical protein [Lachnospiraceae bacterium]